MRRAIPIAVVLLALLAGCVEEQPEKSDIAAAAPIAQPSGSAGTVAPTSAALPGRPAGAPTATTAPATLPPRIAATPSRPAGHATPDIGALQVAWITATVTRGGSGPCYGLTTSAGVTYATYSTQGLKLTKGAQVRARITPGTIPADCGSGRTAKLERVQLAG
ncbi:hypothetical protein Adu01nite_49300 [Paractinoplanes durhamensis]|uniref:Lipoprotein n=1 Tax=Paractinoplanes durhamensis TaxID=113563 RepID=A0ABQ3Z1B8_9ACTN|nr:hypothetical protein Adu01nite_49300 [Actinoplanes durhamensis]